MSIRLIIWLGAMGCAIGLLTIVGAVLAIAGAVASGAFLVAAVVALAIFAPIAWLLAWLTYGPIRYVTQTARRLLTVGDLSGRCWYPGPRDDVAELVVVMNELLVRHDATLGGFQRLRAAPPGCTCPRPDALLDPADLVLETPPRHFGVVEPPAKQGTVNPARS
jgi:hypothetical protein